MSFFSGFINDGTVSDVNVTEVIKILNKPNFQGIQDVQQLTSVGTLPVRAALSWIWYDTTKKYLMIYCEEDDVHQLLIMDCHRVQEVWTALKGDVLSFNFNYSSVMYALTEEEIPPKQKELYQLTTIIVTQEIRCVMVIKVQYVRIGLLCWHANFCISVTSATQYIDSIVSKPLLLHILKFIFECFTLKFLHIAHLNA